MLVKPIPQPEESPKSLLSRYTEGNLFYNVRLALNVRCEEAGNSARFLFGGLREVKIFASDIEKSIPVDLREWFYEQAPGFTDESPVIWHGCQIPRAFFIPVRVRICPCCIKDKIIHQSADFSFFSSCAIHQLKLYESCPGCKKPISWQRGSVGSCQSCNLRFDGLTQVSEVRPAESILMNWIRSGRAAEVKQCLFFLKALRGFYSKEVFNAGLLLEVAVKLQQGNTAGVLELLKALYPSGMVPNRLVLAPLFLACGAGLDDFKAQLKPLLPGFQDMSKFNRSETTLQKMTLRLEEVEFALNIKAQTRRKLASAGFLKNIHKKGSHRLIETASIMDLFRIVEDAKIRSDVSHVDKWDRLAPNLVNNIALLREGKADVSDHDWAHGFSGFWIRSERSTDKRQEDDHLTFDRFAEAAKTYPEAIRRVVKAGLVVPDIERKGNAGARFSISTVASFCSKYCFSTEIAQVVKQGRTIIGAILASAGIKPVSGPKVDGALVPLYLRSDLDGLDLKALVEKKQFKSNAGRKKKGTVLYDRETWLSSKEVSSLLDLCPVNLSSAVSQGYLKCDVPPGRESDNCRYYWRESVHAFKELLQTSLTPYEAYAQLGISKAEFYKRFVGSGFVRLIKIGKQSRVTREDYLRAEADCRLYVGTETATRLTGAPQRHFRNLINTDRISKVSSKETITAGFFDLILRQDVPIHAVMAQAQMLKPESEPWVELGSLKLS